MKHYSAKNEFSSPLKAYSRQTWRQVHKAYFAPTATKEQKPAMWLVLTSKVKAPKPWAMLEGLQNHGTHTSKGTVDPCTRTQGRATGLGGDPCLSRGKVCPQTHKL